LGDITTDGATYCAMEFCGEAIAHLSMEERMTLTNMAIEAGGMNGIIAPDEKTINYVKSKTDKEFELFYSDTDAKYKAVYEYEVEKIIPLVAKPHSPDNRADINEVKGTKLTKCYIGSCTGGKITDFRYAAKILKGKTVVVPTFIVPATTNTLNQLKTETYDGESLLDIFENAGCLISRPSCAACLGGPEDTFGRALDNEIIISTTNRNFPGRMGSKKSSVYLASPLTVAASAVTGVITDVRDFM